MLGNRTVAIVLLVAAGCLCSARAADSDLQLWVPVQVVHPLNDAWDLSMQVELRLRDDISDFSQLVLKPAANFKINDTWTLALGYKYIIRGQSGDNEHDPWQELHFNQKSGDLVWGLQLRLEERLLQEQNGVLPRLRFLGHASHPIGETPWYLTGWGAVRFNLDEKGEGPVSGFEQVRVFGGLGYHLGKRTQVEGGYLYRYERLRSGEYLSDNVIQVHLVFHTKAKGVLKPQVGDRYR